MKFREITEEQARELNTNFLVMWEYDCQYWYQTGFFNNGKLHAYDTVHDLSAPVFFGENDIEPRYFVVGER